MDGITSSPAAIRLAVPQDLALVTTLVNQAYEIYIPRIGRKPMPMLADYAALIARAEVYVLEAEGEVRGVLVLEPHPDHVLIENIAVSPQAQGMGYGKQMMLFSEAFTRAQGMNEIRLYTNVLMYENIARYKHWGYVETERRAEEGFARVFMRKQLT